MDQAINNAISYLGAEALRPLVQTPPAPTSEMVPVISSMYPIALTRAEMPNGAPQELEKKNIHLPEKSLPSERGLSPTNSGHDSTDTDSNHEERQNHIYQQNPMVPPRARTHVCSHSSSICRREIRKCTSSGQSSASELAVRSRLKYSLPKVTGLK